MNITDVSEVGNKIIAFCIGKDIPMDAAVSVIETSNRNRLRVEKYDPNISFSGEKIALMSFYGVDDIKTVSKGEAKIIS